MKYDILLFDLDGVILDFKKTETASFINTFKKYGIEANEEIFEAYHVLNKQLWKEFELGLISKDDVTIGRFKIFFEKMNYDLDYQQFAVDYQNGLADGFFLMPDAKMILEDLSKKYRLYAVTNGVSRTAYRRLEGTDTLKYFKEVFVSEDLNAQKPSVDYFNQVFKRIEPYDLNKILLVGDTLTSDILGANNMSIDSCWLNIDHLTNETKAIPTYEVHSLKDIYTILD